MSRDAPRLYCAPNDAPFVEGGSVTLLPGQAHYLGSVMRQSIGAVIRLFNAVDGEWEAELSALRKDKGAVVLRQQVRVPQETKGAILLFAPLKRDATELVIRMGTELGVTRFLPVITERTNMPRLNLERLSLIVTEAAEQCERLDVPEIEAPKPLLQRLVEWPVTDALYAALERQPGAAVADDVTGTVGLLIGPEGGFSPAEMQRLQAHNAVRALSLGALVLRADTAVCAGLSRLAVKAHKTYIE
ncbi:16S rRNA (uracil(1498)-N(3))-methyltransferase [Neokomagataea anthophila]|uniref:Ribosomal RNA small subunit methyltransferase E n=1 Tax=Neokomagataea anthophila TaxID=2826925 RepID=A0ABS5E7D9_9PROT|nr:16S rRNA (uracil(1498)-N(3))-methyltransferase [Neokomagataea anthophila]MBR0559418.1 16S rRNA (uracil(1498)-N(3))-methyltransferase [Neokomagataea anthophila]